VTVEALLDSSAIGLVISSEFAGKLEFKLKKMERLIYIRNMNGSFNKKGPIKHIVEVNVFYQEYKERTEINMIRGQKWSVILGILWLVHYSPEIDWRMGEVMMTRCLEEY